MQHRNQQGMQIRCLSVWPSVMYSMVTAFNTAWKSLLNLVCFKYLIMTIKDFKQNCLKSHYSLFSPVPQINWRRTDGLPFPSKIKLRKSNGMIEIPNFQQEDAGLYECITENSRGKNIARGRLTYYGRKPLFCPSPTFLYSWNTNCSGVLWNFHFLQFHQAFGLKNPRRFKGYQKMRSSAAVRSLRNGLKAHKDCWE